MAMVRLMRGEAMIVEQDDRVDAELREKIGDLLDRTEKGIIIKVSDAQKRQIEIALNGGHA